MTFSPVVFPKQQQIHVLSYIDFQQCCKKLKFIKVTGRNFHTPYWQPHVLKSGCFTDVWIQCACKVVKLDVILTSAQYVNRKLLWSSAYWITGKFLISAEFECVVWCQVVYFRRSRRLPWQAHRSLLGLRQERGSLLHFLWSAKLRSLSCSR